MALLEITNLEDMQDVSNLLNAAGIKRDTYTGISKSTWEGTPAYLRPERGPASVRAGIYPGKTIKFNFADLESVMNEMGTSHLLLEGEY